MVAGTSAPNLETASSGAVGRRAAARLAAVQALYQIEITGLEVNKAIAQFLSGEAPRADGEDGTGAALPAPDPDLFAAIVGGVVAHRHQLDEIIGAALAIDWTVARLEILVRLILEAGVFELIFRDDIPPKVSLNEYVNVANAFFDGAEPGLINGVLDCVAGVPKSGPVPRGGA